MKISFLGLIVLWYFLKFYVSIKTVYYMRFCEFKQGGLDPLDPPLLPEIKAANHWNC